MSNSYLVMVQEIVWTGRREISTVLRRRFAFAAIFDVDLTVREFCVLRKANPKSKRSVALDVGLLGWGEVIRVT